MCGCAWAKVRHLWGCGQGRLYGQKASCAASSCCCRIRSIQHHKIYQHLYLVDIPASVLSIQTVFVIIRIRSRTHRRHGQCAFEASADAIIDALWFAPWWIHAFEDVRLMAEELCLAWILTPQCQPNRLKKKKNDIRYLSHAIMSRCEWNGPPGGRDLCHAIFHRWIFNSIKSRRTSSTLSIRTNTSKHSQTHIFSPSILILSFAVQAAWDFQEAKWTGIKRTLLDDRNVLLGENHLQPDTIVSVCATTRQSTLKVNGRLKDKKTKSKFFLKK